MSPNHATEAAINSENERQVAHDIFNKEVSWNMLCCPRRFKDTPLWQELRDIANMETFRTQQYLREL